MKFKRIIIYHAKAKEGGIAMKKKLVTLGITATLIVSMISSMTGCASNVQATDLMKGIRARNVAEEVDLAANSGKVTDFAVRLLKASHAAVSDEESILVSPLSVLYALSMTANGAKGDTLAQMENVLGMDVNTLNNYLYNYVQALPQEETYKLHLANSIWFTDDESFAVNEDFLQTNADYYGAEIYKAPFDQTTLNDINQWVNEETDEMIPKILDKIQDNAVMYLINALAFDAEWLNEYESSQIYDNTFTLEDGTEKIVEFMYSDEHKYLKDDKATGFIKYYDDRKYGFAALLPNEGISISDYLTSLDGDDLHNILLDATNELVDVSIPKFTAEYSVEMSELLSDMGMPYAFDSDVSDFTGLGTSTEGNICIDRVLHKTFISVDEKGTKAGAVTAVGMVEGCAVEEPMNTKSVHLDRPFVYMLIDCETNNPFFIGTIMDIQE